MSRHNYTVRGKCVVICDVCGQRDETAEFDGFNDWSEQQKQESRLAAEGWRMYASRSQRHYCPGCIPKPGHKMRLIWGTEPAS